VIKRWGTDSNLSLIGGINGRAVLLVASPGKDPQGAILQVQWLWTN